MTVLIIVVLLVAGLLFAIWFGSETGDGVFVLLIAAAMFISLGALVTHEYGTGELCKYPLESNAIYETLSSTPDGTGKHAVILREQDGSLSAYILKEDPPKMFKVKDMSRGVRILEPFSPVSPATSVPSKK